ncbi:MAG: hypothetical protein AAF889_10185 [Cyanobacteria bacterium P01_D01_bin.73]
MHWCHLRSNLEGDRYKVFMDFSEPSTSCLDKSTLRQIAHRFDLILTKHQDLSEEIEQAELMLFGDSFIHPWIPSSKDFSLSFLCTKKILDLPGYRLRYELWDKQDGISTPKAFYSSCREPIDPNRMMPTDSKEHIFRSMFSATLENTAETNYFTEKIIDCFLTYTIPLYWGAPNIGDYFDLDGILTFSSVEELIEIANQLTVQDYWARLEAIAKNYQTALEYVGLNRRLHSAISDAFYRSCPRQETVDLASEYIF